MQTTLGKNIRLLIMNNLLPQTIEMHYKFDLKGSTYKRFASRQEQSKSNPTLKDLDFNEEFKDGIMLKNDIYDLIIDVIRRDCLVWLLNYNFLCNFNYLRSLKVSK
jgi:1-phosphatidylinositol-4-phosphate 5-kinase